MFSPQAGAAGWGGSLGLASDYVFRGISLSDGEPSVQADGHYYVNGWLAGISAASVKLGDEEHTTAEINAYLGYSFVISESFSSTISLVHYDYPWNRPRARYNYDELTGTLAYSDRVFLSVAASPNTSFESSYVDTSRSAAFAYDLALHWPVYSALSANAGVGYRDLRRQLDAGYVYWNAGLGYEWNAIQLQLAYIGTNATAKRLFHDDAAHHWTATALWHF